jgi:peptidoglycan/LPS O-acetylase OafA/YrhL
VAASPAEALLGSSRVRRTQPSLDGLRGVAVLVLFTSAVWRVNGKPDFELSLGVGHFSLSPFLAMGEAVEWFLVLGAYLVARPFVAAAVRGRPALPLWPFLRRRAARIYPGLWLVLVLFVLVLTPWLADEASVYSGDGLVALVTTATGLGALFPWSFGRWFVLSPLSTITHHVMVYLIVPPLAGWLARRRPVRAIVLTVVTAVGVSLVWAWFVRSGLGTDVARAFGDASGASRAAIDTADLGRLMLFDQFPAFAPCVAFGIAVAIAVEHVRRRPGPSARLQASARPAMAAGLVVAFITMWAMGSIAIERSYVVDAFARATDRSGSGLLFQAGRHTLMGLAGALVLASVEFGRRESRVLGNRWLRCVGVLGFGLYLVHGPVLYSQSWLPWLTDMEPHARMIAAWIVGAITTGAVAVVFWIGLERRVLGAVRPGVRETDASTPSTVPPSGVVDRWLLGQSGRDTRSLTQLDGVRGVAVLLVLATHAWSFAGVPRYRIPGVGIATGHLFSAAASGVTLFFVLSGFLLSRRFLERDHAGLDRGPLMPYFRDRAVRILPLYWVLLAAFGLLMVPWISRPDTAYSSGGLAAFVPFVAVLSTMFSWSWGRWFVITPVWTLTVEVSFYAVVPFVAARFGGDRWRRALLSGLAISWIWLALLRWSSMQPLVETWGSIGDVALAGVAFGRIVLSAQLPSFAFAFAVGMAIASVDVQRRRSVVGHALPDWYRWLVPAGTVGTIVMLWYVGDLQVDHGFADSFVTVMNTSLPGLSAYYLAPILEAAVYGLVIAGLVLDGRPHRLMRSNALRAVGVLGYGIYLWHFPVMFSQSWLQWIQRIDAPLRLPVVFGVGASTSVMLSLLTWFGVERPLLAWNRGRRSGATHEQVAGSADSPKRASSTDELGERGEPVERVAGVGHGLPAGAGAVPAEDPRPAHPAEQLDLFATTVAVVADETGERVVDDPSTKDTTGEPSGARASRRRPRRSAG